MAKTVVRKKHSKARGARKPVPGDRLKRLEAQIAALGREADRQSESAGLPKKIARQLKGVNQAQDQLAKAKRERDQGNMFGFEYHCAAAEDIVLSSGLVGVPGTITKIFRAAERSIPRVQRAKIIEGKILEEWHQSNKPECNRATLIAKIVGCTEKHVRGIVRKNQLKKNDLE